MNKRASLLPKPSSMVIDPSVIIAQHAQLTGTHPITVGPRAVLHPHSKISSNLAPVVIGEGAVIYERAKVGVGMEELDSKRSSVASVTSARNSMRGEGTVLGRNVVVETGAVIEAAEVGEGSVVEVGAHLGRGCVLGKFCTVSAHCIVPANANIPDYTVVYCGTEHRVDKTLQLRPEVQDMKTSFHAKQLDTFRRLIPNNIAKWA
ncbi:hypothetical protein N0V90_007598 [Kalmusia sp. IMI 367209]|nr:hypothetical protein N0V90_007598 [Kalmusia sp. IMI 367209]